MINKVQSKINRFEAHKQWAKINKQFISIFTVTAVGLLGLACSFVCVSVASAATIPVTGVTITPASIELAGPSGTAQLTATVTPANATNKNVVWSSASTSLSTVSSTGLVTYVGPGAGWTYATTADGGFKASTYTTTRSTQNITFNKNDPAATGTMTVQNVFTASLVNIKANAFVLWGARFSGWATSATGAVAYSDGQSFIVPYNSVSLYAVWNQAPTCQLNSPANAVVAATVPGGVSISASVSDPDGDSTSLQILYKLSTSSSWTSQQIAPTYDTSDRVASWDLVLPAGTYDWYAVGTDGAQATNCTPRTFVVSPAATVPVTGVTISPVSDTVMIYGPAGTTQQFTATVTPANATNKSVTWSTNNTSLATVNSAGLVSSVSDGNLWLTAKTADGGFTNKVRFSTAITAPIVGHNLAYNKNTTDTVGNMPILIAALIDPGTTITVVSGLPTRTGYTLSGWNTAANGTGTSYVGGKTFPMPASDVTLYAMWTQNCAPAADETRAGTCPLGSTGTVTEERHSTCPGPVYLNDWHEKAGTNKCVKYCTVSVSIVPSSAFALSSTPVVKTTVSQATSANLSFDGKGTISIPTNGSLDTSHTYSILGIHGATATCTGDDGVLHTDTATFNLYDLPKPCPLLCSTVQKSLVAGTATTPSPNGAYNYQTILNDAGTKDKDVEIKLTATVTDATSALWNYLERSGITVSSSNLAVKELVHMTSVLDSFTPWSNPIGGTIPKTISFTKYGKYKVNLEGKNPGQLDPTKYLTCATCPVAVNINRPVCTAEDIVSDPAKPAITIPANPNGSFVASNIKPLSITFSSKTSKIVPDGVQSWKLERAAAVGVTAITALSSGSATESMPQATFTFRGDYTQEGVAKIADRIYGPGTYKLTLFASSMITNTGDPDPDGECSKTFDFTITKGAECKCVMSPAKAGVSPQKVTIGIVGDSSLYDNSFKLIVNNNTLAPSALKTGTENGISTFYGDITSVLKGAGKYYIAIEAKRSGADPTIPNIAPCEDPSDTVPSYCSATGLCNYTVTTPDGGGGGEVAL